MFLILSIILINLGILLSIYQLYLYINNSKTIYSWSYFNSGITTFSLFFGYFISSFIIGKYHKIDISCDSLYKGVNSFIDSIFVSFQNILSTYEIFIIVIFFVIFVVFIIKFFSQKIKKTLLIPLVFLILLGFLIIYSFYKIPNYNISGKIIDSTKSWIDKIYNTETKQAIGLEGVIDQNIVYTGNLQLTGFDEIKNSQDLSKLEVGLISLQKMITSTNENNKDINQKFCVLVIDTLKQKYNNINNTNKSHKTIAEIGIIILLGLILYLPFRLVFWIFGIINYLFFNILRFLKIYRYTRKEDTLEIDKIE